MDLKRNYSSNIQPPSQIKSTHIVNPLNAIPNASTPVRTRVIKPGSQLNSTPVNVHKIGGALKSPTAGNKQNDSGNSKFPIKKPKATEQNLNLSPIMALNRKMSQGVQLQQRSFTPTGFKRQQSMSNILQRKENIQKEQSFGQTLKDSRSSNSFKNMLQSRSKTPTRVAFAENYFKQNNNTTTLRSSGSANSLLQGFSSNRLKQSRNNKLSESRSFQQLINLGNSTLKDDQVLCSNSNEHQKKAKAKYKVMEQPQDQQILVYCSKCAINLVQKGFKVEDLTPDDIYKIKQFQQRNHMHQNTNQYYDYATQTHRKIQIKLNQIAIQKDNLISAYQKELDDVDCYYNSIINYIQQQKNKDKQIILQNRQKEKVTGDKLERRLTDALNQLNYLMRSGQIGQDQLPSIQQHQSLLTQKGFGYRFDGSKCLVDNIQQKFNHFSQMFQGQGRLRIQFEERDMYPPVKQYFSNKQARQKRDCPLRFSFEKNMKQAKKHPFGFRGALINPLQQAPQSMQVEENSQIYNNERKAFRTLFPDNEEQYKQQSGEKQGGIHSPTFKQI